MRNILDKKRPVADTEDDPSETLTKKKGKRQYVYGMEEHQTYFIDNQIDTS